MFSICAQNPRCTVITDLDTSKRSTQKAFSCCDAILETGPAASMGSELLVAHKKLGQLPLLTMYVVPVLRREINFLLTFEIAPFFCVYPVYIYISIHLTVIMASKAHDNACGSKGAEQMCITVIMIHKLQF
jgi:hypothetical protein